MKTIQIFALCIIFLICGYCIGHYAFIKEPQILEVAVKPEWIKRLEKAHKDRKEEAKECWEYYDALRDSVDQNLFKRDTIIVNFNLNVH